MRVGSKVWTQLFEAAEEAGVRRDRLVAPLGLDAAHLADPRADIAWDTLAAVLENLSTELGHEPERIRHVGRALARAPSFAFLQRLARTAVSPRRLYEAGARWGAPASFPELPLDQTFLSDQRVRLIGSIPRPHAPSAPFFHVFEGLLIELPTMLGLAPARIVESDVTPRRMEVELELPRSSSLRVRLRRALNSVMRSAEAVEVLEQQRLELERQVEASQRSSREIRDLYERMPELVMIHRQGTILWTNPAVNRALDYEDRDALVGTPLLDIVDPGWREFVAGRMRQADPSAMPPELVETRLLTRDGGGVLVEVSPTQIVTFAGVPARLLVGRDITERTRLQQQLRTADRMASIGMLAAGVAHEVNNPLGYVLNNVEMAVKDLTPLGEPTRRSREALAVALEGVDRIRTIVRDLLELSRVDDRAIGPIDARAVVESTVGLAAQKITQRARLETEYLAVPLARGTTARLGQVLLNLIVNALEAMPADATHRNVLRVVVRPSASGGVVVEVADNGIGIEPQHAARVFDPFFTTKASGAGTGLGLAISQRLVAELGGELSFDSLPGEGTTFRLILQAADPA